MQNKSKHKWRFDRELAPEDLLERLTLGELYQVPSCHPKIWEQFVYEKGLSTTRKRDLIMKMVQIIQKLHPQTNLSLEQCVDSIRISIIEKTGHILTAMDQQVIEEKNVAIQKQVQAIKKYLPVMTPIRLLDAQKETKIAHFVAERPLNSLSTTERTNCEGCLEFSGKTKTQSYVIRIVKTRYFQVNLTCKKMSVPARYLNDTLSCATLDDTLQDFPFAIVTVIIQYVFCTPTKKIAQLRQQNVSPVKVEVESKKTQIKKCQLKVNIPKETSEGMPKGMPKDAPPAAPKKGPKGAPKGATKGIPKGIPEEASEEEEADEASEASEASEGDTPEDPEEDDEDEDYTENGEEEEE